ncbi:MAG: chloride channel protein [Bacteroidaceae bacterium]|nr:chloride channel protein [Bacteroidaceae bacterium]
MEQTGKIPILDRFAVWRTGHIGEKQFILLLSLLVGVLTSLAALLLKYLIELIHKGATGGFGPDEVNWLLLVCPVIGIFVSGLFIRYVVRDDIGHGVTKILYALSRKNGRIKPHNMWSSLVASAITIGMGGSVGAESPIVLTGSAIGSNIGRLFKMEHKTLMLLIGCGSAGAIAGIFKAPIAGLVFVLEVLMLDMSMGSLLPLLVSSVTAATISYIATGTDSMFHFLDDEPFSMVNIPYVLLLGVFCGLVSLYFSETMHKVETLFARFRNPYSRFAIGAVVLSALIFLFPSLYGEGYDVIELMIDSGMDNEALSDVLLGGTFFGGQANSLLLYFLFVLLCKVFASTATNAGGGCGGIFAPSLFMGCIAGFLFAAVLKQMFPGVEISIHNFALFGMAGLMSGVMHAPLTGIFLIAELTGGYSMFLPLMMVSIISYLSVRMFQPHSIYSMRLAQKGELLTHHKDQSVLLLMKTENVVEKDFLAVSADMDLGEMVSVISKSKRNLFPVLDGDGRLLGVVNLDSIRNIMFRQELYHRFHVNRFMESPPARLSISDPMDVVMRKFDETGAWNLPVEDDEGKYMGFVSKSKIFSSYRNVLLELSDE